MSGITTWFVHVWRRALVVPALLALARRDLTRGELAGAKARFLRCTHLVPFSFQAHFGLACIYLRERDFSRAQRELMLAREIAPSRFRASKGRLPEFAGLTEPSPALARKTTGLTSLPLLKAGETVGNLPWSEPGEPPFPGDFLSYDEWLKFRRMGPISADEGGSVDWDRVIDDLYEDLA